VSTDYRAGLRRAAAICRERAKNHVANYELTSDQRLWARKSEAIDCGDALEREANAVDRVIDDKPIGHKTGVMCYCPDCEDEHFGEANDAGAGVISQPSDGAAPAPAVCPTCGQKNGEHFGCPVQDRIDAARREWSRDCRHCGEPMEDHALGCADAVQARIDAARREALEQAARLATNSDYLPGELAAAIRRLKETT
jgi:hypothetical protein